MADGEATVYDSWHQSWQDVEVGTAGTMTFDNNGRGVADFTLEVLEYQGKLPKEALPGKKSGFELIIDKGTEHEERWARIDNDKEPPGTSIHQHR